MASGIKTGGRTKGTPNKVNAEIRTVFQGILDRKGPEIEKWITEVAVDNPGLAAKLMLELSEYFVPKLARHEVTGADGEKLQVAVNINFTKGKKE